MNKETIRQANVIAGDSCEKEYVDIQIEIDKLGGSSGTIDGLVERLVDINARIFNNTLLVYGEEDVKELFDVFKCRLFLQGDTFVIIQGKEVAVK